MEKRRALLQSHFVKVCPTETARYMSLRFNLVIIGLLFHKYHQLLYFLAIAPYTIAGRKSKPRLLERSPMLNSTLPSEEGQKASARSSLLNVDA